MAMIRKGWFVAALLAAAAPWRSALAQDQPPIREAGDSVHIRFVDADLRAVVQALARYLPKPILLGGISPIRVTVEAPGPVGRDQVIEILRGLLESHDLELIADSAFFRVLPRSAASSDVERQPAEGVAEPDVRLFAIRLKHARAADVAATVTQLFGMGGEFSGGARGLSRQTLSDQLRGAEQPVPSSPQAQPSEGGARLSGPVTIVPDELTNALLVRGAPADFALLQEAVAFLDVRPLQVLIEVLIVEVRVDRSLSLGTDLFLPPVGLAGDATLEGELLGGGLGDLVLRIMEIGTFNLDVIFQAARRRGDVRIISRPVLLASNNSEARLLVGSQRPFVQVSRSLPTDTPTRDQVVQYRDVGTRLTVLPTINEDGYVSLQIQQEVNAATSEVQFDAPVISTREAATRVLVRDGQTIVLGGLRDRQQDRVRSGIPLLADIPIIGGLFGSISTRTTETELFLFITPRILRTDAEADSVTAPRLPTIPDLDR